MDLWMTVIFFNFLTNFFPAKLLVTTGYIVNQGTDPKPSEVIDLLDAESKCDQFPIFQDRIIGASGALLQNNQTLVCGGYKGRYTYLLWMALFTFFLFFANNEEFSSIFRKKQIKPKNHR